MERWSVKRAKIANAAKCDVSATAASQAAQGEHEIRWRRCCVTLAHLATDLIIFILKRGGRGRGMVGGSGGNALCRGGVGGIRWRGGERKDGGVVVRGGRWRVKNGGRSSEG